MPGQSRDWLAALKRDGFAILDGVLPVDRVAELIAAGEAQLGNEAYRGNRVAEWKSA
jgi:hypothetical protein